MDKKEIIVATANEHKVVELNAMLCDLDISFVTMAKAGIFEDIEENGTTFRENALIKARRVCELSGKPSIADDSGLSVDVLNGEPGIYSARYSGCEDKSLRDKANIDKLLFNMKNISQNERTARFVSAIALVLPDGTEHCVQGVCEGYITFEERGNGGFGYDPIFFVPEFSKTFGELTPEQKNSISHRQRAVVQIKRVISDLIKEEKLWKN